MIRTLALLASLVALAPAASLAAQGAGPHSEGEFFKRLDTNQDGVISKDEAAKTPRIAKSFDKLDADHDGMVTQDEMRAAGDARREEMRAEMAARFKAADTNADGLLSKDEATAGMPRLARNFDKLDTNKDTLISPEELAAARQHMGHRAGKGGPGEPAQR